MKAKKVRPRKANVAALIFLKLQCVQKWMTAGLGGSVCHAEGMETGLRTEDLLKLKT